MALVWILGLIVVAVVSGLIGSGTNEIAKVAAIVFFPSVIALYFAPTIVAFHRDHHNRIPIALLNFFLGWTFLGWIGSLIWAHGSKPAPHQVSSNTSEPEFDRAATQDEKSCPFCAETIKAAAKKCKHCGSELATQ